MTVNLTRQEMIEALIEDLYDSLDYKDLYRYYEYHEQLAYAELTEKEIELEYKQRFETDD